MQGQGQAKVLVCTVCSHLFIARRKDAVFCSHKCCQRAHAKDYSQEKAIKQAESRRKKRFELTQSPLYAPK